MLNMKLVGVIVDCPDPMELARFYAGLTGWRIADYSDAEWATLLSPDGSDLCFQSVHDYRPPRWPDPQRPQQFHLDFEVDDFDAAGRRVVALGATLQENRIGESGYGWQVYIDPAGHPFCLCRNPPE